MTTIGAISRGGNVYVSSSTGFTTANDSVIDNGANPWIFFDGWALGVTGSHLALNVLRSSLENSDTEFSSPKMVITEIGKILTEYDIGRKLEGETTWGYGIWCILARNSGATWDVDESLSLAKLPNEFFWARGSGEKYAIGAAHAVMAHDPEADPLQIVTLAISAAIDNDLFSTGSIFSRVL